MAEPRPAPQDRSETLRRVARRWRQEYSVLLGLGLLISFFAILFFLLDVDLNALQRFGYLGIFLISLIGSASVVLPLPGAAVVVGSGQFVDDVAGIPFFIPVAVAAAAGEALGELTGYMAGFGGRRMVQERGAYVWLERWMRAHGASTLFILSAVPNPFFDVGGFLAGAVRMPVGRFLGVVFAGKAIKSGLLAFAGDVGLEAIIGVFE